MYPEEMVKPMRAELSEAGFQDLYLSLIHIQMCIRDSSKSLGLPSTLWKYGVNDNFELRLITEFLSEEIYNKKLKGFTPVYVGFKVKLADENGIIPKTSFVGHISLPNAASKEFKTEFFAPEFRFVMQHNLSEKLSFSYNLGTCLLYTSRCV